MKKILHFTRVEIFRFVNFILLFFFILLEGCIHPSDLINLGLEEQEKGNIDKAISLYSEAIHIYPQSHIAYFNRGTALEVKGKLKAAFNDYSKAIDIKTDYEPAYYNRALLRQKTGDLKGALKDYNSALKINPLRYQSFLNRAVIRVNMGDNEDADRDYQSALEINPNDAEIHYNRGLLHQQIGNLRKAIDEYSDTLDIKPNHISALLNRGVVYYSNLEYDKAIKDFSRIIQKEPAHASAYFNRGLCWVKKSNMQEAKKDFIKATELDSSLEKEIPQYLDAGIALQFSYKSNDIYAKQKPKEYSLELKTILEETGKYCERIKNIALFFVCKEKIVNTYYKYKETRYWNLFFSIPGYREKHKTKNTFTYDYQLIKKGDELQEKRILIEEDGIKKHDENIGVPPLKYFSRYIVYGSVGFLSRYWQQHFQYDLLRKENLGGKDCFVIEAVPTELREENYNQGEIWVNSEDYSILKIRWSPVSIKNYEEIRSPSITDQFKKNVIWIVTYGVEKNKVRFPDKQVIKEMLINPKGKKVLWDETIIDYIDYRFFVVETEVKFK